MSEADNIKKMEQVEHELRVNLEEEVLEYDEEN